MVRPSLATTLLVALLAILGLMAVALTQRARSQRPQQARPAAVQVPSRPLQPIEDVAPAPKPGAYSVLHVRRGVQLRSKPGGKVLAGIGARTQFGSPTTLTVAAAMAGGSGSPAPTSPTASSAG